MDTKKKGLIIYITFESFDYDGIDKSTLKAYTDSKMVKAAEKKFNDRKDKSPFERFNKIKRKIKF